MTTIKIGHLISEETLSKVRNIQDSIHRITNSDHFKTILEKIDQINKIKIPREYLRFYELADRQRNLYELTNRFQKLEDRERRFRELDKRHIQDNIETEENSAQKPNEKNPTTIEDQLTEITEEKKKLELLLKKALEDIEKLVSEKKKGGRNSYAKYKPLREKLKELCQSEMQKKKPPVSALQLCKIVANKIEIEFPNLLGDFIPFKRAKKDGGDWTKPTFYIWCNNFFKQANAKQIEPS